MLSKEAAQKKNDHRRKLNKLRKRVRSELRKDMIKHKFKKVNRKMRSNKYIAVVVLNVRKRMEA